MTKNNHLEPILFILKSLINDIDKTENIINLLCRKKDDPHHEAILYILEVLRNKALHMDSTIACMYET